MRKDEITEERAVHSCFHSSSYNVDYFTGIGREQSASQNLSAVFVDNSLEHTFCFSQRFGTRYSHNGQLLDNDIHIFAAGFVFADADTGKRWVDKYGISYRTAVAECALTFTEEVITDDAEVVE